MSGWARWNSSGVVSSATFDTSTSPVLLTHRTWLPAQSSHGLIKARSCSTVGFVSRFIYIPPAPGVLATLIFLLLQPPVEHERRLGVLGDRDEHRRGAADHVGHYAQQVGDHPA